MRDLKGLAAQVALVATAAHAVTFLGLHLLEPQLSPVSSIISDYSGTASAWLAAGAFLIFASIWASLSVALSALPGRSRMMSAGRILFALGALAIVVAAVAPASADPRTGSVLANVQNVLARPGLFLGIVLVSVALRKAPGWEDIGLLLVALSTLAVVLLLATIGVLLDAGLGGIGQRAVFILVYVWVLLVSVRIIKKHGSIATPVA